MRYPVGTREDAHLRTRVVPQLAGWLAAWKRQKEKYHATIFLIYTYTRTSPLQQSIQSYS